MKFARVLAPVFAVATSLAACVRTQHVEYAAEVDVHSAELVQMSRDVRVVADADEPLFYAKRFYWLHRDGRWYRSPYPARGFTRVDIAYVPREITSIDRPYRYAHYRRHFGTTLEAMNTTPQEDQPSLPPWAASSYPSQNQPPTPGPGSEPLPQTAYPDTTFKEDHRRLHPGEAVVPDPRGVP
jgi:hypothetical protein